MWTAGCSVSAMSTSDFGVAQPTASLTSTTDELSPLPGARHCHGSRLLGDLRKMPQHVLECPG